MSEDFDTWDIDLERIYPRDKIKFAGRSYRVIKIRKRTDSSKPFEIEVTLVIKI